jgi:hypothetical protein
LSSTTKDKRFRRIERRGSPELFDALRRGLISVRTADSLFYLPLEEQRAQLEHRLAALEQRERRSKAVAGVIRNYLDCTKQIDLETLRSLIREALLPSGTAGG